jgi:DNA/RNA endonuclease G (NUC1)
MAPPLNRIISHTVALLVGASSALVALKYASKNKYTEHEKAAAHDMIAGQANTRSRDGTTVIFNGSSKSSVLPAIKSPITIFNPNINLEIAYDARTKNPIYVMERMHLNPGSKNASRTSKSFHESKDIPSYHRSRNGYYRKSGYDRGHMAAAANYSSDEEMNDTFSLSNISPQDPVMNRIIWSRLERLTRKLVGEGRSAIVITGPLWMPSKIVRTENGQRDRYQYTNYGIGVPPSIVQVPTHFFKVVYTLSERSGDESEVKAFAAFVVPNDSFVEEKSVNLQDFLVRLTDLEATTGLSFFPKKNEETLEVFDVITEDVWMKSKINVNDFDDKVIPIDGEGIGISQLALSKNRKAKIRKRLREISKGSTLPKHMCADGACSDVIKLKKK